MPLYDYRCSTCGKSTEIRHGFNDTYSEPCAHCGGAMTRVFNPAPIVFKGSGFYVTDSRPSGEKSSTSSEAPKPASSEPAKPASSEPAA